MTHPIEAPNINAPVAGGALPAPGLPQAFNNQFELDTSLTDWRGAWMWARGGGGNARWLKLLAAPDAPYSDAAMRAAAASAKAVEDAVEYLAPLMTRRYTPSADGNGNVMTFCNILVNDATRTLHCEIPNNPANTTVFFMKQWLAQSGNGAGWTKTTDGEIAQAHVNAGKVAVMLWSKGQTADHVALVRPGTPAQMNGAFWPRIAQAGLQVGGDINSFATFGDVWARDRAALAFYLHD